MDSVFIWKMEKVLDEYNKPYNPDYPRICFDERPCQLLGDILIPLEMKPGQVKKYDYHYERHGVCNVLLAIEPLTGQRFAKITKQRTKVDYAIFMKELSGLYPQAKKIKLIQDNLNTHNPSSFYETFSANTAFELSERFEMIYTPKKASWLNMAEIEFSALSKQCLDRRIGDMKVLEKEVLSWVNERNNKSVIINWQFTKNAARITFDKQYSIL